MNEPAYAHTLLTLLPQKYLTNVFLFYAVTDQRGKKRQNAGTFLGIIMASSLGFRLVVLHFLLIMLNSCQLRHWPFLMMIHDVHVLREESLEKSSL